VKRLACSLTTIAAATGAVVLPGAAGADTKCSQSGTVTTCNGGFGDRAGASGGRTTFDESTGDFTGAGGSASGQQRGGSGGRCTGNFSTGLNCNGRIARP
jgi:hypothetical protein